MWPCEPTARAPPRASEGAMKWKAMKLKVLGFIGILLLLPCKNFFLHTTNKSVDNKYSLSDVPKKQINNPLLNGLKSLSFST